MMGIEGRFYLPGQASSQNVELLCREGVLSIYEGEKLLVEMSLGDVAISARLGNTPRQLRFDDGSMFETEQNDAVDEILKQHRTGRGNNLLHTLESRKRFILPLLIAAGIAGWVVYVWGIPLVAKSVAYSLPPDKIGLIGEQTIKAMDRSFLEPSGLSEERQQKIRQRFERLTAEVGSGFHYRLYFRQIKGETANAFALPDGTIVLLDSLVVLADHPWEVDGVLLHEIAHVEQRHALQMSFQDTILTLVVSLMLGDAVSVGDAVASLPVLLIENRYSQDFEQSADDFAVEYMVCNGVNPEYFAAMLIKLGSSEEGEASETEASILDYLSTHPTIASRVSRIRGSETPGS